MKKRSAKNYTFTIAMAYYHRYGWIVLTSLICLISEGLVPRGVAFGICCIVFAAHTYFGYILRWKHIYCSYQNAYHRRMTPGAVCWADVKKSDAYGIPIIFFILGVCLIAACSS